MSMQNLWSASPSTPPASAGGADVMPWGKHKGMPIDQVPVDYLRWVLKNADNASADLLDKIEQALAAKNKDQGLLAFCEPSQDPIAKERDRLARELDLMSRKQGDLQRAVKKHERDVDFLRNEVVQLRADLMQARTETAAARRDAGLGRGAKGAGDVDSFRRIVKRWYGAISRRYHPDAGGTAAQQVVANACYQEFMRLLEEEGK